MRYTNIYGYIKFNFYKVTVSYFEQCLTVIGIERKFRTLMTRVSPTCCESSKCISHCRSVCSNKLSK